MFGEISRDSDKVDEYLRVIEERILTPIQSTQIHEYCTATLLLLFAAIDGLGKLLHLDDKASPRERIRRFLDYMGDDYEALRDELSSLRNSVVHNAINVESWLSNTELSSDQHLKRKGSSGFIYVNTLMMYHDVVKAFERLRTEIHRDPAMMKRAADRLEWAKVHPFYGLDDPDVATPSPPPPVEFIRTK
jgi:hypothetical protein